MRQYEYTVGSPVDMDGGGKPVYPVLCRSWDDFDQDAEAWTRVVNWYTHRSTAQIEADAFNANHVENIERQRRENRDIDAAVSAHVAEQERAGDAIAEAFERDAEERYADVPPPPGAYAFDEKNRFISGNGYGGERM